MLSAKKEFDRVAFPDRQTKFELGQDRRFLGRGNNLNACVLIPVNQQSELTGALMRGCWTGFDHYS